MLSSSRRITSIGSFPKRARTIRRSRLLIREFALPHSMPRASAHGKTRWRCSAAAFYSDKGFKPDEDGNLAYGVEQKLPLWGRPKLTRRVAEAETSMRESEVNYRLQQLRADITKALLTTALAERVVEIGEQDLSWVEATAKATDNKYRAGQAVV